MDALQGVLVILVIIQSVVLLIIAVAIVVIFISMKRAIDKINNILQTAENIAEGVQSAARAGLTSLVGKGINESIRLLSKKTSKKN